MQKFLRARTSKELAGLAALLLVAAFAGALVQYGPKSPQFAPATALASGNALTGYAWSDTAGWISFSGNATNGSPYGVTVGAGGALSGFAWSDTIGWVTFDANSCGAQATMAAGALSGFAKAIGADAKGWDGCISLSGASPAYGPTLSSTTFTGYAWGSDVVGWLSFSGAAADGSPYAVVYGGTGSPTCTLSVSPNPAATSSTIILNYTTANSPSSGTLKDNGGATLYSGSVNSSGAIGGTAPSSVGSYVYTMNVTNLSGSGSCQTSPALSVEADVCPDMPGLQTGDPSSCIPPTSINEFTASPARVRAGNTTSLLYNIVSGDACAITGSDGSTYPVTADGAEHSVATSPITGTIAYTLSCGSVSSQTTAGLLPAYQEL